MTPVQLLLIGIVLIPIGLTVLGKLRVDVAALIVACGLGLAQAAGLPMLGPANSPGEAKQAIAGFGQTVVITLLSLFVITRCLDKTGVTRWLAGRLLAIGGTSERRLIILFLVAAAFLSLFMNNLAAGALLLPSAVGAARRTGIKPSKLLIPVAYGTLLGGSATYFTTANIIMSGLLQSAAPPQTPLGVLDFTPAGGVMALVGIAFMAIFAPRLLPNRETPSSIVARPTGSELENAYKLGERLWEARVRPDSALIGQTLALTGIGEQLGLAVVAIWHGRQAILAPSRDQKLSAGDILLIAGREDRVSQLTGKGLLIGRESNDHTISALGVKLIEVMPAPHSHVEGKSLKELEFRKNYGLTAVALWRNGTSYRTDVANFKIQFGDSFLMVGPSARMTSLQNNADFIVLEPDTSDRPLDRGQAALAVGITAAAVIASVLGMSTFLAMMIAAVLCVLTGLISMDETYRSIEWRAIFLVAGMYAISTAMTQTGLAILIGHAISVFTATPFGLLAASYWLTALLCQVLGGQVVALVTGPIVITSAIAIMTPGSQLPQAAALVTAIACSASFLTPVAHPVNILVMGPGNYKFGDFFRIGIGLTIICFLALMLAVPLFWRL